MKLSLATLSLAFAFADAQYLREPFTSVEAALSKSSNFSSKPLTTQVALHGATGEPTDKDRDFIGKALVSSYNDVHWEVGHFMGGRFEVDYKGPQEWINPSGYGWLCRFCPDDDSMGNAANMAGMFSIQTPVLTPQGNARGSDSLLNTAISNDCAGLCHKDAAAALEVSFCDKIRSAKDSDYLASINACAISFNNNHDDQKHLSNSDSSNSMASLDSIIVLKGVGSGDVTPEEHAILAKAFVSAYNEVHWGSDHYLADASVPLAASRANTMILDVITPIEAWINPSGYGWLCRFCPDDDSMGTKFDVEEFKSRAFDKKAVMVSFCNKIQHSASNKLASTKSCSIASDEVIVLNSIE